MSTKKSRVAIIGRPNVGKSTLFNILTGMRRSVVRDQPGVTRDLIYAEAEVYGKTFDLVDTGGITDASDVFSRLIREKVTSFISTVDFCLIIMDGKSGLIPEDRELIKLAQENGKPSILLVNKVDSESDIEMKLAEFYEFGLDVISCSFEQRRGIGELLSWLYEVIEEGEVIEKEGFNIAIIGKPNVGKSSLFNALLGEDRVLVSEIAGTTIDTIDEVIEINGEKYIFNDTAGMRRQAKRDEGLEEISAIVAKKAVDRADLILLVIDGTLGPSDQDARLMQLIEEGHKGVIIVVNKSDRGTKEVEDFRKALRAKITQQFHFFQDPYIVFTSATTGHGLNQLIDTVSEYRVKLNTKISTSELNRFFTQVIRLAPAPVAGTKTVKFYYLTQTKQVPPSFIAFANHPEGVNRSYRRFLVNQIKANWGLQGVPIRVFVMKSGGRKL